MLIAKMMIAAIEPSAIVSLRSADVMCEPLTI